MTHAQTPSELKDRATSSEANSERHDRVIEVPRDRSPMITYLGRVIVIFT